MKKKLALIITIIILNFAPLCLAIGYIQNQDLKAEITLPNDLHPQYAPTVVLTGGNEADYGNYFLQLIAGGLLYLAAPIAVLIIAMAGSEYVKSSGDETKIEAAKKTLVWAVIGLVVIILSYAIIRSVITLVTAF